MSLMMAMAMIITIITKPTKLHWLCFLKVDKIVHEHDREKINKNENWFVSFFLCFCD